VLDAILILRIEDGNDSFISVSGAVVRSAFGCDLDDLAALGSAAPAPLESLSGAARALRRAADETSAAAAAAEAGATAAAAEADAAARFSSGSGSDEGGLFRTAGWGAMGGAAAAASGGDDVDAVQLPPPPPLVPKEVLNLTEFLTTQSRLATPGLFVHSHEYACGLPLRGRQPKGQGQVEMLLEVTAGVRWALDTGDALPDYATAHQVCVCMVFGEGGYCWV